MKISAKSIKCECGHPARKGTARREFRRYGVTIENIPALICDSCGEIYFDGPAIAKIERDLAKLPAIAA